MYNEYLCIILNVILICKNIIIINRITIRADRFYFLVRVIKIDYLHKD